MSIYPAPPIPDEDQVQDEPDLATVTDLVEKISTTSSETTENSSENSFLIKDENEIQTESEILNQLESIKEFQSQELEDPNYSSYEVWKIFQNYIFLNHIFPFDFIFFFSEFQGKWWWKSKVQCLPTLGNFARILPPTTCFKCHVEQFLHYAIYILSFISHSSMVWEDLKTKKVIFFRSILHKKDIEHVINTKCQFSSNLSKNSFE